MISRVRNSSYNEKIIKEGFVMKQSTKYLLAACAGYLVGFYEMKYKTIKAIAEGYIKKEESDKSDNDEEIES